MQPIHFEEVLEKIVAKDSRYQREAYLFMRESLEFTQRVVAKSKRDEVRHVSGTQLLDGIRQYALEQFGPMVVTVLGEWGIHSCADFGEIVFNMVENNLLAKTDQDSRDDFKNGYNFAETFRKPYLPSTTTTPAEPKSVQV